MSNVKFDETARSFSDFFLMSMLVPLFLANTVMPVNLHARISARGIFDTAYELNISEGTFENMTSPFSGMFYENTEAHEDFLIAFATDLYNNQETIDADVEKILFDNLWDLYQT